MRHWRGAVGGFDRRTHAAQRDGRQALHRTGRSLRPRAGRRRPGTGGGGARLRRRGLRVGYGRQRPRPVRTAGIRRRPLRRAVRPRGRLDARGGATDGACGGYTDLASLSTAGGHALAEVTSPVGWKLEGSRSTSRRPSPWAASGRHPLRQRRLLRPRPAGRLPAGGRRRRRARRLHQPGERRRAPRRLAARPVHGGGPPREPVRMLMSRRPCPRPPSPKAQCSGRCHGAN